jgi:putative ABC transport system substrate-binding protein
MIGVGDPVASGIVESLVHPGGNVTGLAPTAGLAISGKRLALLKETVPKAARVAALWDPTNVGEALLVQQLLSPAQVLGLTLHSFPVRKSGELEGAFARMAREQTAGLLVIEGQLAQTHRRQITALAAKHRIPGVYGFREFVQAGGLMAYAANRGHLFQRAAIFVDKILKDAKPTDLPVEQPTKFELVLNMRTAKALGLTIPPSVLARADQVIE